MKKVIQLQTRKITLFNISVFENLSLIIYYNVERQQFQ